MPKTKTDEQEVDSKPMRGAEKIDPKIADMQERARAAQQQARALRKEAPGVMLQDPMHRIPQKDLFKKYAERDGFKGQDDPAGFHYMFGDRNMTDQYPDLGYEPVLEKGTGGTVKQVTWGGDPMWKIPTDLHNAQLKENADRANRASRNEAERAVEATNRSATMQESLDTAEVGTQGAMDIALEAGIPT